jgi:Na+-transporting NADH:ubiquinone oxidoreductase subunit B
MKLLRDLFSSNEEHFTKGGKFEKFHPLFDATKTFFFLPRGKVGFFPFLRYSLELKRFMSIVILSLIPLLIFGIYNTGYQANLAASGDISIKASFLTGLIATLPLIIVSYGVGFSWEIVFSVIRKHKISEGFLVTGLLYPMILPPSISLIQAAVGISFGVIIGKEIFGGTGRNILNPALTARAFLFFAYPSSMSGDAVWIFSRSSVDAVTSATPLSIVSNAVSSDNIGVLFNQAGLSLKNLFIGNYAGCIGETSAMLCFLGGLLLIITGVGSFRTIFGGIIGLLVTSSLVSYFMKIPFANVTPIQHLLIGGFAFGIVFMATDPVSSPGMNTSKWIYGFLIGFLTVIIRVFNPAYPEGVMLAILFMNVFAPLLDYIETRIKLGKRMPNV